MRELAKGSHEWRIVPELAPDDVEPLAEKSYGDSFEDTNLETVFADLGGGRLVVGAQTDACIRSTEGRHGRDEGRRLRRRRLRSGSRPMPGVGSEAGS